MQWVTTTQVLEDLKSSKETPAWQQFCNYFYPVVANFARKLGLSATDAEDAAQETMVEFLKAFRGGKYDREQGRLSSWLLGVAKHVILNLRGNQPLERLIADKTTGTSFWDMIEDENGIKHTWDTEWRQMVLTRCLEQARRESDQKVFKAFELYALLQKPVEEVCQTLGMSRNAVYIAKSRILSKLRQLQHDFEGFGKDSTL
jgi:RNA polymerase sigma-70 factor (ECF subfamily)